MQWLDAIWLFVGFLLTLMVFSYLLGDNPLFRIATYLFIGVTAGYVSVLLIDQVLWPRLVLPIVSGTLNERLWVLVPLILSLLLVVRLLIPAASRLSNLSMAYLAGAGAAIVVGGAVMGTLSGQFWGAIQPFGPAQSGGSSLGQWIEGAVFLFGTLCTLIYFQFGARVRPDKPDEPQRPALIEAIANLGRGFLGFTLGAIFAGVYATAISALVERMQFLMNTLKFLIFGG